MTHGTPKPKCKECGLQVPMHRVSCSHMLPCVVCGYVEGAHANNCAAQKEGGRETRVIHGIDAGGFSACSD
jgi:hypothetical protein